MRVFPYSCTKRLVCKKAKKLKRPQPDAAQILRRYILLLSSICKSLPWEITCLRKAVALRDALHAAGVDSVIRLGVNRGEATIAAHAWLECCGSEVLKNGTYSELRLDSV